MDAETGGQKSALETADVRRDGKSGDDTGEIPAETTSLESPTKCAVWEDWMVVCAVQCEPVSTRNSRFLGNLTGNWPVFGFRTPLSSVFLASNHRVIGEFPVQLNRELRNG